MEERKFYRTKTSSILAIVATLVILAVGFWALLNPESMIDKTKLIRLHNFTLYTQITGVAIIMLSLFFGFLNIRNLYAPKALLHIHAKGLEINMLGQIHIDWNAIDSFKVLEKDKTKGVLIMLKDPISFNENLLGVFPKMSAKMNFKMLGSPVFVATNGLNIKPEELQTLLNSALNDSKVSEVVLA